MGDLLCDEKSRLVLVEKNTNVVTCYPRVRRWACCSKMKSGKEWSAIRRRTSGGRPQGSNVANPPTSPTNQPTKQPTQLTFLPSPGTHLRATGHAWTLDPKDMNNSKLIFPGHATTSTHPIFLVQDGVLAWFSRHTHIHAYKDPHTHSHTKLHIHI